MTNQLQNEPEDVFTNWWLELRMYALASHYVRFRSTIGAVVVLQFSILERSAFHSYFDFI
jgi:hypothetical protein